jgi:putative spermidine/putrescine transport system substrate-binding protein
MLKITYIGVIKGAKHKAEAMRLLSYLADPRYEAEAAKVISYTGPNPKMFDFLPKEQAVKMPTYPDNYRLQFHANNEWWVENRDWVFKRWQEWKLK